jgi:hypothetical protein
MDFADISNNQHNADLAAYAAAGTDPSSDVCPLIVLKATEGVGFTDGFFADRWRQAKALDLCRWAYHLLSNGDPDAQAERFLTTVRNAGGLTIAPGGPCVDACLCCDRLLLDWEGQPAPAASVGHAFAAHAARAGMPISVLYTGKVVIEQIGLTPSWCANPHLLVLAQYKGTPAPGARPDQPVGWRSPDAWQWTDGGAIGVKIATPGLGAVDRSRWLVTPKPRHPGAVSHTQSVAPDASFPGQADANAASSVVLAWQGALIAAGIISDGPANRDGVFGPGMAAAITRLQTSFGWTDPDGIGGAHTWSHMTSRAHPPCPRCGE